MKFLKPSSFSWVALGLLAVFVAGCASSVRDTFLPNMAPEVRLTAAPVSTADKYFYAFRMNWVGFDPDGKVTHFLIAVDPARPDSVDDSWQVTTKLEEIIFFRASQPDSFNPNDPPEHVLATDYHVFAIAAVDDKGMKSPPVYRAFFAFNQAPLVFIDVPRPQKDLTPLVTPTVRIKWHGIDPDGQFSAKPVKYRFKLFKDKNTDFPEIDHWVQAVSQDPDIIRRKYAPTFGPTDACPTCTVWDSTNADTTEVQYHDLIPDESYIFAVTGFDEAGAYDPIFSLTKNVLRFVVTFAGTSGPQICMFNEFFQFCYQSGGYSLDPSRYYDVEVPANQQITFSWIGLPPPGSDMRRYRWTMDLADLTNETPRTNEQTDWYHWSAYGALNVTATVGPFAVNNEQHLFYIEAEDNNGLKSLGIIRFTVVKPTFDKQVLFVKDTRLNLDQRSPNGTNQPPVGPWPTTAELDTFFFAQGGVQWGDPVHGPYPPGTLSRPGIFKGYGNPIGGNPMLLGAELDTISTYRNLTGVVSLAKLGQYRHVIWYTDAVGAVLTGVPGDPYGPITALRHQSQPGQPNTLATYMRQGGQVWLFGGGAAYANLSPWTKLGQASYIFTNQDNELVPGRMMYDFFKWQSEITVLSAILCRRNGPPYYPDYQIGRGWVGQPDYSGLPVQLTQRAPGTDPLPPLRFDGDYYTSDFFAEYLSRPNFIREDADSSPNVQRDESTLDTLYYALGGAVNVSKAVVMSYYHGQQSSRAIFSGFPLWQFSRDQVIGLVDFVMHDIWGYPLPPAGSRTLSAHSAPSP